MNEPAFPVTLTDRGGQIADTFSGMTLRDYFAAKALPVFLQEYINAGRIDVAGKSYELADAMLKSRTEPKL